MANKYNFTVDHSILHDRIKGSGMDTLRDALRGIPGVLNASYSLDSDYGFVEVFLKPGADTPELQDQVWEAVFRWLAPEAFEARDRAWVNPCDVGLLIAHDDCFSVGDKVVLNSRPSEIGEVTGFVEQEGCKVKRVQVAISGREDSWYSTQLGYPPDWSDWTEQQKRWYAIAHQGSPALIELERRRESRRLSNAQ